MALTADQLANIRDEISDSTPPTDEEVEALWTRKGESLTQTVLAVLTKRYAALANGGPLNFTVVGEYSEDRSNNLKALEAQIKRVRAEGVGGEGPVLGKVTVGRLGGSWGR